MDLPGVAVLIPARNEEQSLGACLQAVLKSELANLEVLVWDDGSTDKTAAIVEEFAKADARVKLFSGVGLPAGWNGKQHACWQLSQKAQQPLLLFIDADVRLTPDAVWRLVLEKKRSHAALLSAFPFQETVSFWERLLIPLMHFVLLGYLPIDRMRNSSEPAYAAGCGQLFLTAREEYLQAGTHAAIRQSRHDGVKLPRAYRQAGLRTDICDGSGIARCRMYHNGREVRTGLLKNAVEGIAQPKLIGPFTILLIGGSVMPFVMAAGAATLNWGGWTLSVWSWGFTGLGILLAWYPRWQCAIQFKQSWVGAALHPLGVSIFVILQWIALWNYLRGRQVAWRGRTES
jgi:glycosyltransferase involved in cell wall biosynthesis